MSSDKRDPIVDRYAFERLGGDGRMSSLVHKDHANSAIIASVREARAEGERAATERIVALLKEYAGEAHELWAAKRDSVAVTERWESEYWRGQMNGLHHVITDIEGEARI